MANSSALLYGYFGQDNFGDDWMLESFIQVGRIKWDAFYVTVGEKNYSYTENYGIPLYSIRECDSAWENLKVVISYLGRIDTLVFLGGTQWSNSANYKISRNIFKLIVVVAARLLNRKIYALSVGVDDYSRRIDKLVIWLTFRLMHEVSVRDKKSYSFLTSMGISTKLLSDITVLSSNIHRGKDKFDVKPCYKNLNIGVNLVKAEKWIDRSHFYAIEKCLPNPVTFIHTKDDYYLENHLNLKITTANYRQLEQFDLVIASRLHIVKACIYLGVPVLPLEYAFKVGSLASDYSMDWYITAKELKGDITSELVFQRIKKSLCTSRTVRMEADSIATLTYLYDLFNRY